MKKHAKRKRNEPTGSLPLTAGSPAPQGPTSDDILNRFRLGKHIVEVKAQLKYLEEWATQLDRDIAGKRAAVRGNTRGEPTAPRTPSET